jgi:hypothetical protein
VPANTNKEIHVHPYRTALAIASAIAALCTFLPWVEVPGVSVPTPNAAWLTFLIAGAALIISLVGDRKTALVSGARTASIICGAAVAAIAVLQILDINSANDAGTMIGIGSIASVGTGLYVLVFAGAAIALLPVVIKGVAASPSASTGSAAPIGPQCTSCGAPLAGVAAAGAPQLCPPCQRTAR